MKVASLFFDLGGTLVDLGSMVPAAAIEIRRGYPELRTRAATIADEWVRLTAESTPRAQDLAFRSELEVARDALVDSFRASGVELDRDAAVRLVQASWGRFLGRARLQGDVSRSLLHFLRSNVQCLGIITDSDDKAVGSLLARFRLRRFFDVIVVSESVGAYKPNPRIYLRALEQARTDARASRFVSDSPLDLHGAAAVGMGPIWIRRGLVTNVIPVPPGTVVLEDLRDLQKVLESNLGR